MGYSGDHVVLEKTREKVWLSHGELRKEEVYLDPSSYWQLVIVSSEEGVEAGITCLADRKRLWGPHLFREGEEAIREALAFLEGQAAQAEELGRQFGAPEGRYLPS